MDKAFPDILAVDPVNCGCTECIIGEYVPQRRWEAEATPADLAAFLSDEVRNNTYDTRMSILQYSSFGVYETREFVTRVMERLNEEIESIDFSDLVW